MLSGSTRLLGANLNEPTFRADPRETPAPTYRVSPNVLAAGALGLAGALVLAALFLLVPLVPIGFVQRWREARRARRRTDLERALLHLQATAPDESEVRPALERLASELGRVDNDDLAVQTRRLAWSEPPPVEEEIGELSGDVDTVISEGAMRAPSATMHVREDRPESSGRQPPCDSAGRPARAAPAPAAHGGRSRRPRAVAARAAGRRLGDRPRRRPGRGRVADPGRRGRRDRHRPLGEHRLDPAPAHGERAPLCPAVASVLRDGALLGRGLRGCASGDGEHRDGLVHAPFRTRAPVPVHPPRLAALPGRHIPGPGGHPLGRVQPARRGGHPWRQPGEPVVGQLPLGHPDLARARDRLRGPAPRRQVRPGHPADQRPGRLAVRRPPADADADPFRARERAAEDRRPAARARRPRGVPAAAGRRRVRHEARAPAQA